MTDDDAFRKKVTEYIASSIERSIKRTVTERPALQTFLLSLSGPETINVRGTDYAIVRQVWARHAFPDLRYHEAVVVRLVGCLN